MAFGQNEAVAVGPVGAFGVVLEELGIKHGQDVDDLPLAVVEALQADLDPFGQALGERPQRRPGEVAALLDEGLEEPEDEQRVALGPAVEPVDQLRLGRRPDDLLGQLPDGLDRQRADLDPVQDTGLLQVEQHPLGHRVVGQLAGPGRGDDEDPLGGQAAGEVVEGVPGRGVGQVDVVEDDDHRRLLGQVGQQDGQPLQQPGPGRFPVGGRPPDHGDAPQQRCQVVQEAPT